MHTAAVDYITSVESLTEIDSSILQPVNDTTDPDKVEALTDDMRANGWRGAPLVAAGEQGLTGSHRIAAVLALWDEGIQVRIPRIQIDDLCEAFGTDWGALEDEYGMGDGMDWYEAARHLDEVLPSEIVEYLGLDIH